jgi:hypothetical protein
MLGQFNNLLLGQLECPIIEEENTCQLYGERTNLV